VVLALALPACAGGGARATARAAAVRAIPVATLDGHPTAATMHRGDPRLYVTLQDGRVVAIAPDGRVTTVLDMRRLTAEDGERGLLGIAIAPNGKHVYLDYTDTQGNSHVDELAMRPGVILAATRRRVLYQPQPYPNHNGGDLVFGPDGYLYVGFGDGGAAGDPQRRGQKLSTWLGKILRIDPRRHGRFAHGSPAGNPFVHVPGARKEIWSYGLRNPWKLSFDKATHELWIGDVGQNAVEEIDHVRSGRGVNFGWSAYEGTHRYNDDQSAPNATMPVYEYLHSAHPGGCAVTGGFVYRGSAIPSLVGTYVFGDYCTSGVRGISAADPGAGEHPVTSSPGSVVAFAQSPAGEIYALSHDGAVVLLGAA
jgi:glucose/arabinose dehydrogenase